MSKLIYTAFSVMDQEEPPPWVQALIQNPVVHKERWAIYNPWQGFLEQMKDSRFANAVMDQSRVPADATAKAEVLKLDPQLFMPLDKVSKRIGAADEDVTIDLPFKDLYALLRSDIMLIDLNEPSHGGKSQEVLYAYLLDIPIVGISHRFIVSPWIAGKTKAVIFPKHSSDIVQQIFAYDYKFDLVNQHFVQEIAAAQTGNTQDYDTKLASLQDKLEKAKAQVTPEEPVDDGNEQQGAS